MSTHQVQAPKSRGSPSRRPRLLVVSPTFPYPLVSGGKQRVFYVLRHLSEHFEVTLLSLAEEQDDIALGRRALSFLDGLETVRIRQDPFAQLLRLMLNGFLWPFGTPAEVIVKRSSQLRQAFQRLVETGRFDAIQVEFSQLIPLLQSAGTSGLPTLFVAHDISYVAQKRKAETSTRLLRSLFWRAESRIMRRLEARAWNLATRVQTVSETDREHVLASAPDAAVDIIPNGVDARNLRPRPKSALPEVVFVGWMRHLPNRDAVGWLLSEIWPLIRQAHTSVRLIIVGDGLPDALEKAIAGDPRIDYLGRVDDIACIVGRAWVSLAPIRIGSGSRIKILESMALGTPVVTTTVGCEGLPVQRNAHVLISDTAAAFSTAVLDLLGDLNRRQRLANAARAMVESRYDWRLIGVRAAGSVRAAIAENPRERTIIA